jgi:transposase
MSQKKSFSKSRKRSKFKISNWSEYNNILRNRGRIDFMIAEDLSDGWYEDNSGYKKRGGQRLYSDKAILMCMQLRYLFGLKLRQSEGFINWIFKMSGFSITCPNYTTLSKRGRKLNVNSSSGFKDSTFDYVCIDSTGIQTYAGNEWLENKHGKRYERRIWKKLHIVIKNDGLIVSNTTTEHNKDDRSEVNKLLQNVNTKELLGDTGYDGDNIYQMLRTKGIKPTIRPPNIQVTKKAETEREHSVAYQQKKGYHAWRNKNKYGRRELVENTFFRLKNSFGSKLLSRDIDNMKTELTIKCQLLNKMFEIGKPISMRIA